jgi:hypothetical protein
MFSVADLPELDNGGKGNKMIEIPKARLAEGERVAGVAVVAEGKGRGYAVGWGAEVDFEVDGSR